MPLSLLLNPRVWMAIILVVLEAMGGWKLYRMGTRAGDEKLAAYKAEQTQLQLDAEVKARAKETELINTNQKVTENYESLKTATATAVGALDAERVRLMSRLAAASGAPKDSGTGLVLNAPPQDRIRDQCLGRYEEVAGDAQALSDQVVALQSYIQKECK